MIFASGLARVALAGVITALATPAFAHHPMGGTTPSSLMEGLLSGLGHPVIGLDHFAFIVGVGIACAMLARGFIPLLAFITATLGGSAIHLMGVDLPVAEIAIAASVLLIGAGIAGGALRSAAVASALFAIAGVFHGYAYGEAIIGAEPTALSAYLAGFAAIQFAVAFAAMKFAGFALRADTKVAGGMIAGIGVALVFAQAQPLLLALIA
jgi:urease accessory protein